MLIGNLLSFDRSISLIKGSGEDHQIEGLTTFDQIKPNHLLFLKDQGFFEKLRSQSLGNLNGLSLLVCQKFYKKLEGDMKWEEISSSFSTILVSADFDKSLIQLSKFYYDQEYGDIDLFKDGREGGTCSLDPSAKIAPQTFIGVNVVIKKNVKIHSGVRILANSVIGEGSEIFPNSVIYPKVFLGKNCRIHANSTIGADGFGYSFYEGVHNKMWHFGGVVISDNVEIGANTMIDSGTFSPTVIGEGCKIDNSVQIAHNCQIGNKVIICGQVGISGSCKIGDYTILAGRAGLGNGLTIGKNVQIGGGALVNCDWPDNSIITGYPARQLKEWLRGLAYIRLKSLKKE